MKKKLHQAGTCGEKDDRGRIEKMFDLGERKGRTGRTERQIRLERERTDGQ